MLQKVFCFFGLHKLDKESWNEFWDVYWNEEEGESIETGLENFCKTCKKRIRK